MKISSNFSIEFFFFHEWKGVGHSHTDKYSSSEWSYETYWQWYILISSACSQEMSKLNSLNGWKEPLVMVLRSFNSQLFCFIVLHSISKALLFTQAKPNKIKAVWHLVQHLSFLDNWYTNEPNECAHTNALKRWNNSRKA